MALSETHAHHCSFSGTFGFPWPNTTEGSAWSTSTVGTFSESPNSLIFNDQGKTTFATSTAYRWYVRPTDWAVKSQNGGRLKLVSNTDGAAGDLKPFTAWARVADFGSGATDAICFYYATGSKGASRFYHVYKIVANTATNLYTVQNPTFAPSYPYWWAWRVVNTPDGTKCFCELKCWTDGANESTWTTPVNTDTGTKRVDSSTQLAVTLVVNEAALNGQSGYAGWGSFRDEACGSGTYITVDDFEALEFSEAATGHTVKGTVVTVA